MQQQRRRQKHNNSHCILSVVFSLLFMFRTVATMATASTNNTKKGALIFLHGLGDTPAGWSELEYTLPEFHKRLEDLVYVFPPAPTIPITINGGMTMPGWFDLYDWPIGVGSRDDKKGLLAGVSQIQAEIEKLQTSHGIPPDKIVVGGFSQGGAVALLTAYRQTTSTIPLAGCAGLSCWLTLPDELKVSQEAAQKTPMFWGHGKFDDKVLFEQQAFGVQKLLDQGVNVEHGSYPMGHQAHPDEMKAFADFLDHCIFGKEEGSAKQDL